MNPYESKKWIDRGWGFAIAALVFCIPLLVFAFSLSLVNVSELADCLDMGPEYAKILPLNKADSIIASVFLGDAAPYPTKKLFSIIVNIAKYRLIGGFLVISCISATFFLDNYQSKGKKADWIVGMVSSLLALQPIPAILFVTAGICRNKGFRKFDSPKSIG